MPKEMNQYDESRKIMLRSVYGKTEQKYWIHPVKDPKTKRYPNCVKEVDDRGNLIMTDAERNSGKVFLSADDPILVQDGKIFVRVNHVMEEEHYIEWISIVFDGKEKTTYFKPGDEPVAHCKYVPGSTIYAYCNKHELWKAEVE